MKLLVTGGAGFIGSNFVTHVLHDSNHSVVTVDSLTYAGSKDNLDAALSHARHQFVEGDIRDASLIDELMSDVDAVINFAAESHVDRSIDGSEPFVSTNIQGTQVLLDAALKHDIDRFVQISTDEVYGERLEGRSTENDTLDPRNPYAATKAGADLLVQSYCTTHDLPGIITRSSNNFGPHQHSEKLIPKLITRAADGNQLPIYGDGTEIREWLYVADNCRAIRVVLENGVPGEVYNIGSGCNLQNIEVARRVINAVGASEDQIKFVEDRPGHDRRYALDSTKISGLGWKPECSFENGLEKTIEYYLQMSSSSEQ